MIQRSHIQAVNSILNNLKTPQTTKRTQRAMITTRSKESTMISRERKEREAKQAVTLNPNPTLQHNLMKLMTTKEVLMKAKKAIKARQLKTGRTVFSEIRMKKRKKISRVKIQIKMITTLKTALTETEIVLQMKRMKMDLTRLLLAILLPGDHYSLKNLISMRMLAMDRSIYMRLRN